jgi:hypothetical protein
MLLLHCNLHLREQVVNEAYKYNSGTAKKSNPSYPQIRQILEGIQNPHLTSPQMAAAYKARLLPLFPTCMHKWFIEHFRLVCCVCVYIYTTVC